MEPVVMIAGVAGFDATGVGGRKESVAESAGEGIVMLGGTDAATRGDGETIEVIEVEIKGVFTGNIGLGNS